MGDPWAGLVVFGVLGPVVAWSPEGPVELGEPRLRAVLSVLLLDPGRHVSVSRVTRLVWGEGAPANVRKSIQGYVSKLRRARGSVSCTAVSYLDIRWQPLLCCGAYPGQPPTLGRPRVAPDGKRLVNCSIVTIEPVRCGRSLAMSR